MRNSSLLLTGALLAGCSAVGTEPTSQTTPQGPPPPITLVPTQLDQRVAGLSPAPLVTGQTEAIDKAIDQHYASAATHRAYILTDKPLYQPGETIWFRVDVRQTATFSGGGPQGAALRLISPRGSQVFEKRVLVQSGVGRNDFALPAEIEGGEYTIRLSADDGTTDEKKIIVQTYEAPRLQKTLEFLRKAYGAGDAVSASVEVKRASGEPLGKHALTGVVTLDDAEIMRLPLMTDADGKVTAKFTLPASIARGDGLLTILAEDAGVTESIQKRIPIVMHTLQFGLYPEGGDLVEGLPGRVYFAAKTTIGKPADVEGIVVDDRNTQVASFSSVHDGMGRFEVTPAADRSYKVVITKPAGITATFPLAPAHTAGCVLRAVDQHDAKLLRVAATCSTARTVVVEAVLREKRLGAGAVDVVANEPTLIELPVDAAAQGAVRVTLFSAKREPLAERLVYHGMGADLKVTITADKKTYSPRDKVKLHVHTVDASGAPIAANLGLSVVDDTVLSFADDKSARILAHLYLEPELGATSADPIEEPNYYFSTKPDAAAAMDALLGTRGYRRFEWRPVLAAAGVAPNEGINP
ncbi:MAG TPA: MG2 domain-containing protein [Kofleriaceae bacterium]|jgi:hypothetical protein